MKVCGCCCLLLVVGTFWHIHGTSKYLQLNDEEEDTDKEDQELFYFFDCVGFKNIFREKAHL